MGYIIYEQILFNNWYIYLCYFDVYGNVEIVGAIHNELFLISIVDYFVTDFYSNYLIL